MWADNGSPLGSRKVRAWQDYVRAPRYRPGMAGTLREIIIDCNDSRLVADFWSRPSGRTSKSTRRALDVRIDGLAGSCRVFVQVSEGKSARNRMYLDVSLVDASGTTKWPGSGHWALSQLISARAMCPGWSWLTRLGGNTPLPSRPSPLALVACRAPSAARVWCIQRNVRRNVRLAVARHA